MMCPQMNLIRVDEFGPKEPAQAQREAAQFRYSTQRSESRYYVYNITSGGAERRSEGLTKPVYLYDIARQ